MIKVLLTGQKVQRTFTGKQQPDTGKTISPYKKGSGRISSSSSAQISVSSQVQGQVRGSSPAGRLAQGEISQSGEQMHGYHWLPSYHENHKMFVQSGWVSCQFFPFSVWLIFLRVHACVRTRVRLRTCALACALVLSLFFYVHEYTMCCCFLALCRFFTEMTSILCCSLAQRPSAMENEVIMSMDEQQFLHYVKVSHRLTLFNAEFGPEVATPLLSFLCLLCACASAFEFEP